MEWVTLASLPPGTIFITKEGVRAVKSEYHLTSGQCECILLDSGEYAHFPNKNGELVSPLTLVDLDKLLDWVTANVYDSGHGLLGPPNWVVDGIPLLDHLLEQTGLSAAEMGARFDAARRRVHGEKNIRDQDGE
jgi:hypothetical protein